MIAAGRRGDRRGGGATAVAVIAAGRRGDRRGGGATAGRWRGLPAVGAAVAALAVALGGCGYNVELPDLFALTRTGPGGKLTMVVNESGQITCRGRQSTLTSSQIITARDLSQNLADDASRKLTILRGPGSVYYYRVKLQQGTIAFPDRAATDHRYLGQVEAFALQAASQYCP